VCENKQRMRSAWFCISLFLLILTGCTNSSSRNKQVVYTAGDKATLGSLVYSVTDTATAQQLGDDQASTRTAQERFYLVKVSVSNSGTEEQAIPAMSLVDDSGKSYPELPDGTNVQNWLGVVRKVASAQTEQGYVVFDAPTKHYRLRLNDSFEENEIAIDVPLSFVHEQSNTLFQPSAEAAAELAIPGK
jgi:hypothetical protein